MSQLDEWKKRVKESSVKDEETIKRYMDSKAVEGEPFRLEVLQSSDTEEVLIQGNLEGLRYVKDVIDRLINTNRVGGHSHLEDGHGLTKSDVSLIIQLVGDDENIDGSHVVS